MPTARRTPHAPAPLDADHRSTKNRRPPAVVSRRRRPRRSMSLAIVAALVKFGHAAAQGPDPSSVQLAALALLAIVAVVAMLAREPPRASSLHERLDLHERRR